jgi:integrase
LRLIEWYLKQPKPKGMRGRSWEYLRAAFALAYYAAMGCAELAGLRWKDVDLVNGIIHISSNHVRNVGLKGTKTPWRNRHQTIWPEMRSPLEAIAARQTREGVFGPDGHVFRSETGCSVGDNLSSRHLSPMLVELGITKTDERGKVVAKFSIHGIRAAGISAFLKASNGDVMETAKFAGHKDGSMIWKHYGYSLDQGEARRRAIAGMREILALPALPAASCDKDATEA